MIVEKLVNVSKRYSSGILALDNINLEVNEHEILTFLGPNGAGKTTLLRIMALLETPTEGHVYFKETLVRPSNIEKLRLNVTMMFQKVTFFNTTVFKNIAYGLKLRGYSRSEVEKKVKHALGIVRLVGFENRHIQSLSGGEQQRVALARAIVLEPELLLLDEPLANIDPVNASILEKIILELKKKLTIVQATHDILNAARLADRIIFINQGRIIQSGTVSDVLERPIDKLTAKFIGFENVFEGTANPIDENYVVVNVGDVPIEAISDSRGKCNIAIRPEDIIVSKKKPVTSARNVFSGTIKECHLSGPFVKLEVEVNEVAFKVVITKRSFIEMGLKQGDKVFISFKASAVKVF